MFRTVLNRKNDRLETKLVTFVLRPNELEHFSQALKCCRRRMFYFVTSLSNEMHRLSFCCKRTTFFSLSLFYYFEPSLPLHV